MLFSSLTFLFAFLPITLILYHIKNNRNYRNIILLIVSLIFYSWGEPKTIIIMIFAIIFNYFIAIKMEDSKNSKPYLIYSLIFNIGILFFFKYFNFFVEDVLMVKNFPLKIMLPIGISFYTFQIMSYVIDVYRGVVKAQRNILYLGCYVSMFPQLIAGPIVRYETIAKELIEREESIQQFAQGLRRFIIGLAKKIIIANQMAIISDKIFLELGNDEITTLLAWSATLAFTLQIYFDFSGYSDMAIGLGHMFGFKFLENFNYPYIAKTVTDFWRRWHISLSSWFKDYVYIPLGGSRVTQTRWIFNIAVVWALTGLWHGASYNFIIWGIYYGIILVLEKIFLNKVLKNVPIIQRLLTLLIILISWVIFNSTSISQIFVFLKNMFVINGSFNLNVLNNLGLLYLWPYAVFGIIGSGPFVKSIILKLQKTKIGRILVDIYLIILLIICLIFLINSSYNPFIYFRF